MRSRIFIVTGEGKGKTTSAFGMALRSLGHGCRAAVIQFVKRESGGEAEALRRIPGAEVLCCGLGFLPRREDAVRREAHLKAARDGWRLAQERLTDPAVGTVVLDEIFHIMRFGALDEASVGAALRALPEGKIVVLTGRGAPESLIALADTVSRIECVKHAFRQGIRAQECAEF